MKATTAVCLTQSGTTRYRRLPVAIDTGVTETRALVTETKGVKPSEQRDPRPAGGFAPMSSERRLCSDVVQRWFNRCVRAT